MGEEELDEYAVFDTIRMTQQAPEPVTGRWRRVQCLLGLHIWGFVRCPACQKFDPILKGVIDKQWAGMSESQKQQLQQKAKLLLQEAFGVINEGDGNAGKRGDSKEAVAESSNSL